MRTALRSLLGSLLVAGLLATVPTQRPAGAATEVLDQEQVDTSAGCYTVKGGATSYQDVAQTFTAGP
jgi:hypothetical protein